MVLYKDERNSKIKALSIIGLIILEGIPLSTMVWSSSYLAYIFKMKIKGAYS